MLLSADQFCDLHAGDLTVEIRRSLLDRLGMYGVRLSIQEIRDNAPTTAATLAPRLVERVGLVELRRVIAEHFLPACPHAPGTGRAGRAAQPGARDACRQSRRSPIPSTAKRSASRRAGWSSPAFAPRTSWRRARHSLRDGEREELDRLLLSGYAGSGAGSSARAPVPTPCAKAALSTIETWRAQAGDPFADQARREVCETAARTAESIYASVV